MKPSPLDFEAIKKNPWTNTTAKHDDIAALQVAVYVMAGGGMIGRMAAEQPSDFYIDSRCGRRPYSTTCIYQAVKVLVAIAEGRGMDPHNMPRMPNFHNCGIF